MSGPCNHRKGNKHMLTRPIKWLNRRPKIAATAPSAEALSALDGTYAAFTETDSAPPQVIASGTVPDLPTTPDSTGYQWNRVGISRAPVD
jgi:predicted ribosomally synthesized peptide with SipW-like signal peptide